MTLGNFNPLLSRYCEYRTSTGKSPKIGFSTHVSTRSTRFVVALMYPTTRYG